MFCFSSEGGKVYKYPKNDWPSKSYILLAKDKDVPSSLKSPYLPPLKSPMPPPPPSAAKAPLPVGATAIKSLPARAQGQACACTAKGRAPRWARLLKRGGKWLSLFFWGAGLTTVLFLF